MSLFPGANATVYYNEAGEPLGWDNNYYDNDPYYDYDPYDDGYYDDDLYDDEWQDA